MLKKIFSRFAFVALTIIILFTVDVLVVVGLICCPLLFLRRGSGSPLGLLR